MKFYGIQKTSLVNYPGKISLVLFTGGCNLKCGYCYNRDIVNTSDESQILSSSDALELILQRTRFIDAVVITGGEPTIHKNLKEFISLLKQNTSLAVKLDTNGFNPEILKSLLQEKLLDYVAVDIKTSPEKYESLVGVPVDMGDLSKSLSLLNESGVSHELRSTIVPGFFSMEDLDSIRKFVGNTGSYNIQQFVNENTMDPSFDDIYPLSKEELLSIREKILTFSEESSIRGI